MNVQTLDGVKLKFSCAQIFLVHIYSINCILPAAHTHWNTNCHVQLTQSSTHTLHYTIYSCSVAGMASDPEKKEGERGNVIHINNFKRLTVKGQKMTHRKEGG